MTVLDGYAGEILEVNLSTETIQRRKLFDELARNFLGARGLAAALLYQELEPDTEPLSPGNVLIFMTGPSVGTPMPSSHRSDVTTKSPLTGSYLCSSAGGFFGPELKSAGFDGIVINGRAESPVYVSIEDGEVEIREADHLWGEKTDETETEIRNDRKDSRIRVACIGPAGENLSKIACIVSDSRTWGRGGAGAVMGSKNLKAVAVRGRGDVPVFDEKSLAELSNELREELRENPVTEEAFSNLGTAQFVDPINEAGMFPTRNFQEGVFEGAENINASSLLAGISQRSTSCYGCPIGCGHLSMVSEGPYADTIVDGPEYETIWSFGAQCGVDDLSAIAAANLWCDQYGLDTISAGNTIGFAMECYEKGILSEEDVDGLELEFGNHRVYEKILRKMSEREGIGNLLADGVEEASQRIGEGSERFAIHVKGMELPAYDPRGAWGMALAYATSCRGGCHLKAWTISAEILNEEYDPFSIEGKAELVRDLQDVRSVLDSVGVCTMSGRVIGLEQISEMLSLVTGEEFTEDQLKKAGERIYNLERLLAAREGLSRSDDTIPPRLLDEALEEGPPKDIRIGEENFEKMLDEYYEARGWDEDGEPTEEKLKELRITSLLR